MNLWERIFNADGGEFPMNAWTEEECKSIAYRMEWEHLDYGQAAEQQIAESGDANDAGWSKASLTWRLFSVRASTQGTSAPSW